MNLFTEPDCSHQTWAQKFNGLDWAGMMIIIADNKPEAIFELRRMGMNVKAAYKPAGSVVAGIDVLKANKLNVSKQSVNLIKELRNYQWKLDSTGKSLNVPVDKFNHGIDALCYAVMARVVGRKRLVRISGG